MECLRCGYKWTRRTPNPTHCPSCTNPVGKSIVCKCGCGHMTEPGNNYIWGHSRRGVTHTVSEDARRKMSETHKGVSKTFLHSIRIGLAVARHYEDIGNENSRQLWACPEWRKKTSEAIRASLTPEVRRKMSLTMRRLWENPHYKAKCLTALIKARVIKPTRPELIMMDIIRDYNLPFKYVGNGGSVVIGGRCPDFISTNGIKMVILVDGTYWHRDPFKEMVTDNSYRGEGYYPYHITEDELYSTEDYMIAAMVKLSMKEV